MKKRSLLYRIITCLVAGFVTAALWLLIGRGATNPLFPKQIIFTLVGLSFSGIVIFPFIWQYLLKRYPGSADRIYAWLYAIIRYAIALDVSIFGWKKFFHLQFVVPQNVAWLPIGQLSGETLTWFYFGYSYRFGCIVACIQLAGSAMLLFRRTWLFGAIILFALMLNIMLIDIFYYMNGGALNQSVILTAGLLFLILTEYDRLAAFFFNARPNMLLLSFPGDGVKASLRLAGIVLPVLYTWYQATH